MRWGEVPGAGNMLPFWESLLLEMEAAGLHCQGVPQLLSLLGLLPATTLCPVLLSVLSF